jgi:puromycin-sensitive aminopeptidase
VPETPADARAADQDRDAVRLPRTALPTRYDLVMEPDLRTATFRGVEDVALEVTAPVDELVCNAADLEIDAAWLATDDGRVDLDVRLDAATQRLHLRPASSLAPGLHTVHVEFRGVLNDKLKGFYRSTYVDGDGVEQTIATTQMEPTDARRAFPCWDEPDIKAVFGVTLVVDEGLMAIANGGVLETTALDDGRLAHRFADTIPMSTYLVAFIVGKLEATDPVDVDGTPLRTIHVPGKGHLADFSLDVGAFCLRFFSDYYGIPYPGDKCDLLALPDFAAGAMENLGAITFREAVLLVDPATSTRAELNRVADVVAHELAHMWFGDLVTMKWWNGLWLNEAFATFMELLAIDAFRPDWERWGAFSLERSGAMDVDALGSTRPIEYPVRTPSDAEGMFDVLTYQKGAAVLRMLERYLGEDGFRRGIRRYLDAHRFGNAETTDLWDAIEEATGEPVRRIMDSWIFQGGYPVVDVEAAPGGVRLSQRRFRFDDPGDADPARWAVPVVLRAVGDDDGGDDGGDGTGGDERRVLLDDDVDVPLPAGAGAVVVNAGGHGFYRVRYAPELLAAVTAAAPRLSAMERYLLVDDTWASVLAGRTSAADFLALARGFGAETDRTVWAVLVAGISELQRVADDAGRTALEGFARELIAPTVERLGWAPAPDEDELTRALRGMLLSALGIVGADEATRATAREVHERYLADPTSVDPNVAAAVTGIVAHGGDEADYEAYVERFRTSTSPQEQLRYLYSLASFRQADLADRTLAMTLAPDIRSQNAPFVLLSMLQNRDQGERAWRFVTQRWDEITARFPDNSISRFLGGVTSLSTPTLANEVRGFLAEHPVPQGAKQLEQTLERLQVNVALREREGAEVARALAGG